MTSEEEWITVELEERDRTMARRLAKDRTRSFKEDPEWDINLHSFGVGELDRAYRGAMGELAFGDYADLYIDAETYERSDGGDDFQIKYQNKPATIDVKSSNNEPFALMVKETKVNADYFVLAHIDDLSVTLYGMASAEVVLAQELEETPHSHRNHNVPISELEPVPDRSNLTRIGSS